MHTAYLARSTVVMSLILAALLTLVSILTMPDFSGPTVTWLEEIAGSRTALVSNLTWIWSQLFLAVSFVGVAHLLVSRVPRLGLAAGVLLVLGTFGHAVGGGVQLFMLVMAQDPATHEVSAALLDQYYAAPYAIPFFAAGLLGTALGFVMLGIALLRARLGAAWLGIAAIAWVPMEFVLGGLSPWMGYASGTLFLLVFAGLADVVRRSSISHWQTAADAVATTPDRVPA